MVIFYSYVSLPASTWIGSQRNCWLFPCFPKQKSLPWSLKHPQPLVTANEAMVHLPVVKGMIFHFASRQPKNQSKMDEKWMNNGALRHHPLQFQLLFSGGIPDVCHTVEARRCRGASGRLGFGSLVDSDHDIHGWFFQGPKNICNFFILGSSD